MVKTYVAWVLGRLSKGIMTCQSWLILAFLEVDSHPLHLQQVHVGGHVPHAVRQVQPICNLAVAAGHDHARRALQQQQGSAPHHEIYFVLRCPTLHPPRMNISIVMTLWGACRPYGWPSIALRPARAGHELVIPTITSARAACASRTIHRSASLRRVYTTSTPATSSLCMQGEVHQALEGERATLAYVS